MNFEFKKGGVTHMYIIYYRPQLGYMAYLLHFMVCLIYHGL